MRHNRERANDARLVWSAPDAVQLPVYCITPEGQFLFVNASACASLGYTRDGLLRMTVPEVDPDCPAGACQAHRDSLEGLPRTIRSVNGPLCASRNRDRLLQDAEHNCAERCVWAS